MRFEGFLGNAAVKETLSRAVDAGRIPHALLIEGPKGSGRKRLARLIAKAAVCSSSGERPCGVCADCRKADTGHADILVLQGDGSQKSLSVERVRDLRDQVSVLPNEAQRKAALILDAGCMGIPAQNALLKVLEDPPDYMVFVLTALSRSELLPTVQSRCMCLSLRGVDEEEALPAVRALLPLSREQALESIRLHGGCLGQVLADEREDTAAVVRRVTEIARGIMAAEELTLLLALAPLERDKPLTDEVLASLLTVLRDALAISVGGTASGGCAPDTSRELARSLTTASLLRAVEAVERAREARKYNMNQTLLCTSLCAKLRAAVGR